MQFFECFFNSLELIKLCTKTLSKFLVFKTGFMVNVIELYFNETENK